MIAHLHVERVGHLLLVARRDPVRLVRRDRRHPEGRPPVGVHAATRCVGERSVTSRAMKSSSPRTALTGVPSGARMVSGTPKNARKYSEGVSSSSSFSVVGRSRAEACQTGPTDRRAGRWLRLAGMTPRAVSPDRLSHAPQGGRRRRARRPAAHPRPGPAVAHRLRGPAARAADLPGAAGRRRAVPRRPAARGAGRRGLRGALAGHRGRGLGRDRGPVRARGRAAADRSPGPASGLANRMWAEQVLRFRGRAARAPSRPWPASVLSDLRMRKSPDEVDALRARRPGHRPGAPADGRSSCVPGRTEREAGRTDRRGDPRGGPRDGRLRHRRLRAQRRLAPPRGR